MLDSLKNAHSNNQVAVFMEIRMRKLSANIFSGLIYTLCHFPLLFSPGLTDLIAAPVLLLPSVAEVDRMELSSLSRHKLWGKLYSKEQTILLHEQAVSLYYFTTFSLLSLVVSRVLLWCGVAGSCMVGCPFPKATRKETSKS
jgi:hypothetical protein